eukprot:gene5597-7725_t
MSCVTITHPNLFNDINKSTFQYWFDLSLQHSLFLSNLIIYIVSHTSSEIQQANQATIEIPRSSLENKAAFCKANIYTPQVLYSFENADDLPTSFMYAKTSVDKQLLAIQQSLTSVVIIDISTRKKWTVEIKYSNENVILSQGILWSEHGGKSQDLIIITTRGLELYKVSSVRNQCKLSRVISQPSINFWYEPNYRMILLCSFQKNAAMKGNIKTGEVLLMDGYFFKMGKSSIPLLELPPPDKSPRFELGPGVQCDDITLLGLYEKLCCLVHYPGERGISNITIYYVTKTSVERAQRLSINLPFNRLYLSVDDNLLICHSIKSKLSYIFDIRAVNKKKDSSTFTAIDQLDSLSTPTPIDFSGTNYNENNGSSSPVSPIKSFTSLKFQGSPQPSPLNSPNKKSISNHFENNDISSSPIIISSLYSSNIYEFYPPNYLWDKHNSIMWRIKVEIPAMRGNIFENRDYIQFLQRRGLIFYQYGVKLILSIPDENSMNNKVNENVKIAKQHILLKLFEELEKNIGLSWLEEFFRAIMMPYSVEQRRIIRLQSDMNSNSNNTSSSNLYGPITTDNYSNNTTRGSVTAIIPSYNKSNTNKSSSSPLMNTLNEFARRASFSTSNVSNYNSSLNDNNNDICWTDNEPLEPDDTLQLYLSDINLVAEKSRKMSSFDTNELISIQDSDIFSTITTSMTLALSIRRDNNAIMNVLPDSIELAMKLLELYDILIDIMNENHVTTSNNISNINQKSKSWKLNSLLHQQTTKDLLKEYGLNLLWILDEKITIVKWYLGHGYIFDAISICCKKNGGWTNGLQPGCISSKEFLNSSFLCISSIRTNGIKKVNEMINKAKEVEVLAMQEMNSVSLPKHIAYEQLIEDENKLIDNMIDEVMFAVYMFIQEWDSSILLPSAADIGRSRLAIETVFPSELFNNASSEKWKVQLGYN